MKIELQEVLRQLPAVDQLLGNSAIEQLLAEHPRSVVIEKIRSVLDEARSILLRNREALQEEHNHDLAWWNEWIDAKSLTEKIKAQVLAAGQKSLRRVINSTGVVLHTNLGRAVLSEEASKAVQDIALGYSNLELDLERGERGSRYAHVEELLMRLTGAEAALVVNNNAAAVLLALSAMAEGKEVVVSRGQLVEIGGAFRVPEVMEQSGCILKEVGTTNKTHLRDYQQAINDQTGLLLKVHTSNYRVVGFTQEVSSAELAELGQDKGIPVLEDIGSGFLVDLKQYGIGDEPIVQASISAGVDVVTFSGDKLLGGPQAGIIIGKDQYIRLMKKHPLTRALRIDKLTLAALEATLRAYLDEEKALSTIPTLSMLTRNLQEINKQADELAELLKTVLANLADIELHDDYSQVGGGALPLTMLPTKVVRLKPVNQSVQKWAKLLRSCEPAVVVRVQENSLILDPRTILTGEISLIGDAFKKILVKESHA